MVTFLAPHYDATELRTQLDFQAFYTAHEHTGKRSGRALIDRVPWRDDHKPSFNIYSNGWLDRATGEHGDVFAYLERRYGHSFAEALNYVATWLNYDIQAMRPLPHPQTVPPTTANSNLSAEWQSNAAELVKDGHAYLLSEASQAVAARHWLHARGIDDDLIHRWRLGYNPTWRKTSIRKSDGNPAYLAPGILIPCLMGETVHYLKVRCRVDSLAQVLGILPDRFQDTESPKYTQLAGGNSAVLFNAEAIQADRPVLYVEGEFDAMLAQARLGGQAVVVTLGSASQQLSSTCRDQLRHASRVLACYDNDAAGQRGQARLLDALDNAYPVSVPTGKDLTDFVIGGGDLVAWFDQALASSAIPPVSDGLRSAALNCDLNAGLIVYELICTAVRAGLFRLDQPIHISDLLTASDTLQRGIDERLLRRGMDQGVAVFLTKMALQEKAPTLRDTSLESSIEESSYNADFVRKPAASGRTPVSYHLLPVTTIRANLLSRLPVALLRKYFPIAGMNAILPEPIHDLLDKQELSESEIDRLLQLLQQVYEQQDQQATRKPLRTYHWALDSLNVALANPHSTPLPSGWVNGKQYAAILYRAIHEADPKPRTAAEIALITGRRANHIKGVIEQAGMESVPRPAEVVRLAAEGNLALEICQVAKGRGLPFEVLAMREGQPIESTPLDLPSVQTWAAAREGYSFAVKLRIGNIQRIVGEVQPPIVRQPRRVDTPMDDPLVAALVDEYRVTIVEVEQRPKPSVRNREKRTIPKPPPIDRWLRDYLLIAYCRLHGQDFEAMPRDVLTVRDVVDLLLDQVASGLPTTLAG